MDGLTCVRRIRELQREGVVHGHVPVVAVTANVRAEQVEIALKAGMDDVISKPFRIPELCACIQKTLGRLAQV
jgi:CheY-like chemotaxis protein